MPVNPGLNKKIKYKSLVYTFDNQQNTKFIWSQLIYKKKIKKQIGKVYN